MFKLVIEDDEGKRTPVALTKEDYAIGRKEGNTIRLTERNVSRDHARLLKRNGGQREAYWLEDLASYNGVYVNGLRVAEPQELLHGDLIQIGDYRILFQDDVDQPPLSNPAMDSRPMSSQPNVKATIPMGQGSPFRGSHLMERPNRLVMLVGPTPGTEYPLDRERMTIGRAEEATISVNHNSVSRLHCEIHALGEGRYEIVDKGSANGVRVNAADLRRGIIEAGDVIELGDVRFKFVAAGQVFVAGANESQQLGAIGDREAPDTQAPQKPGSIVPFAFAGAVVALVVLGGVLLWLKKQHTDGPTVSPSTTVTSAPTGVNVKTPLEYEQAILTEAKRTCTKEDCEAAHVSVTSELRERSPLRQSADFKQIESDWAASTLERAEHESDPRKKEALLRRVRDTPSVDNDNRNLATDRLKQLEQQPIDVPETNAKDAGTAVEVAPTATTTAAPPTATPTTRPTNTATAPATATPPTATTTTAAPTKQSDLDRARDLMKNNEWGKAKHILYAKAVSGRANAEEADLLIQMCRGSNKDPSCLQAACKINRTDYCKNQGY